MHATHSPPPLCCEATFANGAPKTGTLKSDPSSLGSGLRQWLRRWQDAVWQRQCQHALRQLSNSTRRDLGLSEVDDSPPYRFY
jgi:hypothetical protein